MPDNQLSSARLGVESARMSGVSVSMSPLSGWFRRPTGRPLTLKITVIVEPDEDWFHAYCPSLEGLHVDGETVEDALSHARDAVLLYLESLARHGDPLPVGPHCVVEKGGEPIQVPIGAFLRHLELPWPSPGMPGAR